MVTTMVPMETTHQHWKYQPESTVKMVLSFLSGLSVTVWPLEIGSVVDFSTPP